MQWSFLSVDCRISGFNFLKVKIGVFIDICLFLESSVSPKAPSLLTVPLPSLTSPHPAWSTEPCVSLQGPSAPGPWHRSSSPAPHSPALPAQGWGCTSIPQMPTSCWRWHGPWHQTLPWDPLCPDMALLFFPTRHFQFFFTVYHFSWSTMLHEMLNIC